MKSYRLTKKQVKRFEDYIMFFVYDFWNLSEWDVSVNVTESDEATYGTCAADTESCMALFGLNRIWRGLKPTKKNLGRIAFHEACELLMWDLQVLANSRYATAEAIGTARHKIITTMENRIYKELEL